MRNLFLTITLLFSTTYAQQTITNMPSSDVLDKGKAIALLDTTFKFDKDANNSVNRFSSFVPRTVIGIGKGIEIGLNVNGNFNPGRDQTTLSPTIKWKFYDKKDWALVVGNNLFVPVKNRSYKIGNYVYAQASRTFKSGTRLTLGSYHFSKNVVAPKAQRAGGQFAIEHPLNKRFSLVADYYTGKHAYGYFTPATYTKISKRVALTAGYSLGNADLKKGNHFFYTELIINLN
jgi:hypothetical protein